MAARFIDDLADWLATRVSGLTRFNATTQTGNLRTDSISEDISGLQVAILMTAPGARNAFGNLRSIQVYSGSASIEVIGPEASASDAATAIYDQMQWANNLNTTNFRFLYVSPTAGYPTMRGVWKPGIRNYGIDIDAVFTPTT